MNINEIFEENKKEGHFNEMVKKGKDYNLNAAKGTMMLDIANGDETTPQIPWSWNHYPYRYDTKLANNSRKWGLRQLEDGRIVQTFIKEGKPVAYIISKKNAIRQITKYQKYGLIKTFKLSKELYNLVNR
jgi:hypothetical protein